MDGWTRIRGMALARLTEPKTDGGLGWIWRERELRGYPRLQLVSPRGVVWDFRLKGGAWMRKANSLKVEKKGGDR